MFINLQGVAQNKNLKQKPIVKQAVWFRVSPPLTEMIENAKKKKHDNKTNAVREIKNEFELHLKDTKLYVEDPLSKLQQSYNQKTKTKAATLTELADFDGANRIDLVIPPDTQGDVNENYYMQCTNNYTVIKNKSGTTIKAPFPTSDFWQGSGYDDRNDGDPVILWDEDAQRWIVTQFYLPDSGDQYLLIAISQTSDPTGSYYQYAFSYGTVFPDYPKWAVWPDAYYVGANGFEEEDEEYTYKGAYMTAFERSKMIAGDASARSVTFGHDSSLGGVFPADADAFPAYGTPCTYVTDQMDKTTGNNKVYLYDFHVDWDNPANSTFGLSQTFTVSDYGILSSTEGVVPQPGVGQKLNVIPYVMYRPYYRHFADHESLLMTRTVKDGSIAAIRWYEFRKNADSPWSLYQEGTYNPGDGIWRWLPSIAMNANGDIAIGYSVSNGTTKYPSIRCVARYADDPLGVMTTSEVEFFTGSASQDRYSRWGDYAMMSVDPSDNTSFWFTTEYTSGGYNWRTRITHFELPVRCTGPTTQATSFTSSNIEDNQVDIGWTRGNGDKVIVVAHKGSPVTVGPVNGTSYTANAAFGSGSEIGAENFVVYDGTGQNLTVTDLTPGTQYYFSIYEYFTADQCYTDSPLTGNITTTGTAPCSHCYSWGHNDFETSTTRVVFNTIDNASAKPTDSNGHAYSDYTDISTDVVIGDTYNLTVQVNTDGEYTVLTNVWIDWNRDCDFDDAGEAYDLGSANNVSDGPTSNSPLSISVPAGAVQGQTIMRVSTKYDTASTSCQTNFDGEVEDYKINITPAGAIPSLTMQDVKVYPNPSSNKFYITFNSAEIKKVPISVTDLTGKVLIKKVFKTSDKNLIDLTSYRKGIYFLKLTLQNKTIVSRLILK